MGLRSSCSRGSLVMVISFDVPGRSSMDSGRGWTSKRVNSGVKVFLFMVSDRGKIIQNRWNNGGSVDGSETVKERASV